MKNEEYDCSLERRDRAHARPVTGNHSAGVIEWAERITVVSWHRKPPVLVGSWKLFR